MVNRRLLFLVLTCCLLAFGAMGCDDDDDDNGTDGGGNGGGVGTTSLSGDAGGSFIQNAEVAVLTFDGDTVATTTTDNTGAYTVTIPDDQEGPFLLRVQGTAEQSQLVTVGPDGTDTQPFIGPWYSLVTADDLIGDEPRVNVTPLTTIAVWMMRAEAAKAGQADEALIRDYGSLVENMSANVFLAGLETGGQFFAPFDIYASPALPKGDLTAVEASELVANRAASAIVKDLLSNLGTSVEIGSSAFAGNLAMFGLDLSDGMVDGQVEGFDSGNLPALESLYSEAMALIPGGDIATVPTAILTAIDFRFSAYTGSDIEEALTGLGATLDAEANALGVANPPAFIVPAATTESELVANPPAQMLLILNPAVVEIPAGQETSDATSILNFVVLDGKGQDVTDSYVGKLSASVISNGNVDFLEGAAAPEPITGGAGYSVETLPFNTEVDGAPASMGVDNTATVTVRILGTSLECLTMDNAQQVVTFVQPTTTPVATAINSASMEIDEVDNVSTLTIDLATTTEPAGQTATGVATLTVDNGWFWSGSIDNVSKSLMGLAFLDGEPFEVGYLSPDNVTDTTVNVRIDLENNTSIVGLASAPIDDSGDDGED